MMTVTGAAAAAASSTSDPRLRPAAHEFEASMMKEFLEPLQHDALFNDGDRQDETEGSGNTLMSFGSESLAKAISARGGFGIAAKIIEDFDKQSSGVSTVRGDSEGFLKMDRKT